jgi:tripartite-type tricarboxylate transporter receptor subunit TctC
MTVENKPGGGAYIGLDQCANAAPDGYTLCFVSTSPIVISPHMTDAPYDPMTAFTFIGQYGIATQPLVVRNDGKFNSLDELLDHARAHPGSLRWSAAAFLGGPHLATEAMFRKEGVQTVYLPSQGGAVELANLLAGTIDLAVIADYGAALNAGQVKLIGETTPVRNPNAPDIRTFQELGYPLSPAVFIGFAGPAGIPQAVVDAWDEALAQALQAPEVKELMSRINTLIVHRKSADFTAQIEADYEALGEVLKTMDFQQK